jgi:hypothetical protein
MVPSLSQINKAMAQPAAPPKCTTVNIKQKIFALAESYAGTGDSDFTKQKSFDPLIAQLLKQQPQPPVRERLSLLAGA